MMRRWHIALIGVSMVSLAWLLIGLTLTPGLTAAFTDGATVGASIRVADALDCDDEGYGDGPGCLQRQFEVDLAASVSPGDDDSVAITVVVTGVAEAGPPLGCVRFHRTPEQGNTWDEVCESEADTDRATATYHFSRADLEPGEYSIDVTYLPAETVRYLSASQLIEYTVPASSPMRRALVEEGDPPLTSTVETTTPLADPPGDPDQPDSEPDATTSSSTIDSSPRNPEPLTLERDETPST